MSFLAGIIVTGARENGNVGLNDPLLVANKDGSGIQAVAIATIQTAAMSNGSGCSKGLNMGPVAEEEESVDDKY